MQNLFNTILISVLFLILTPASSQTPASENHQLLEITYNKTSSLVFATAIKSVDRGSNDILAQKAKETSNVLHLKAGRKNFSETNLTVITADGNVHEFTIHYADNPNQLINRFDMKSNTVDTPVIFTSTITDATMEKYATEILGSKKTIRFIKQRKHKMSIALQSIYIIDDIMFYHLQIKNQSNINYTTEFIRFYIEDKTKAKRTAAQESTLTPHYTYGDPKQITAQATTDIVYAMEKFTIPDSKLLHIEIFEHNGGRNLTLSIKNRTIVNAAKLP